MTISRNDALRRLTALAARVEDHLGRIAEAREKRDMPRRRTVETRREEKLQQLLGKVFDKARAGLRRSKAPAAYKKLRHDFVFHMTDWVSDLEHLHDIYHHPEKSDPDEACTFIIGFFYHVIPHLNAAGRLLLDEVRDPFLEPTIKSDARS